MKFILLNLTLFITACAAPPEASSRSGSRYTVDCKHSMSQCYFKAQDKCMRQGYSMISSNETEKTGGPWGRYREYTINIQCK